VPERNIFNPVQHHNNKRYIFICLSICLLLFLKKPHFLYSPCISEERKAQCDAKFFKKSKKDLFIQLIHWIEFEEFTIGYRITCKTCRIKFIIQSSIF